MKTIAQINIVTNPELASYSHASTVDRAEGLAKTIEKLEADGFVVLSATGSRSAVPNSYRSAYKVHAPYYAYDAETRTISMVDGKLQNRSKGNRIPAVYTIAGQEVPSGFRCFRRLADRVEIRRA